MAIRVEQFDDAEKFLHELRMSSPRWGKCDEYASDWVFRGQGNSTWKLLPSLWRDADSRRSSPFWKAAEVEALELVNRSRYARVDDQLRPKLLEVIQARLAEVAAVYSFWRLADTLGFDVEQPPNLSQTDKSNWLSRAFQEYPLEPCSATALAQHHGIQTRLLDFARHPFVAAYFAASSISENAPSIAVWAIDESRLASASRRPQIVSYPRSRNRYMHAQSGVFLFLREAEENFCNGRPWPCVGEFVESYCGERSVVKLELSAESVPRLLQLLMAEQFSRAHLMPSLDNVATTVKAIASTRVAGRAGVGGEDS